LRHIVLVMAALSICAVTAAQLRDRTDTQAPAPVTPDQAPPAAGPREDPADHPEIRRLLAATRPATPHAGWPGDVATRPGPAGSMSVHV
jgi:hypothetical protein